MWKEAKMRPHAIDKKDWTEYLEFKDYEKIFCHHCRICNFEERKFKHNPFDKKKGGIIIRRGCKKSNWDLYFEEVFGGNYKIFVGDIDNLRELRNSLKHDEALSDIGKADLLHLYTKMNKYLCNNEDKSKLV